jgi:hypothetical protein
MRQAENITPLGDNGGQGSPFLYSMKVRCAAETYRPREKLKAPGDHAAKVIRMRPRMREEPQDAALAGWRFLQELDRILNAHFKSSGPPETP